MVAWPVVNEGSSFSEDFVFLDNSATPAPVVPTSIVAKLYDEADAAICTITVPLASTATIHFIAADHYLADGVERGRRKFVIDFAYTSTDGPEHATEEYRYDVLAITGIATPAP